MSWVAEVTSLAALWGRRLEDQGGAPVYGGGIWDGGGSCMWHQLPALWQGWDNGCNDLFEGEEQGWARLRDCPRFLS